MSTTSGWTPKATVGCVGLIMMLPACLWYAFVASRVWNWFAVPFFAARPLGVGQALGLLCIWWIIRGMDANTKRGDEKTAEQAAWDLAWPVIYALAVLGVAAVARRMVE